MHTYRDLTAFLHYNFSISTVNCTDTIPKRTALQQEIKQVPSVQFLNARKHKFDYIIGTSNWKTKQNREIFPSARMEKRFQ